MTKKLISIISIVAILMSIFSISVSAANKFPMDYIYSDKKNEKITNGNGRIYIPVTYISDEVFSFVDDENQSAFSYPQDIFIDSKDNIYIADTGNDRIVKISPSGKTLKVFYEISDSFLSEPSGVYVDENNEIYVADSGNNRIVVINQEGELIKEYGKPKSNLLESLKDESFIPTKVAVGTTGYIYTLVGKDFMTIDKNGEFRGYMGSTKLDFSLKYALLDIIFNDKQMEKLDKRIPPAYTNFTIDVQGRFLASSADSKDQIRILNSLGENIYPSGFYGEILSIDSEKNDYIRPRFVDLASDKNGVISALDGNSGCVYQYDQEGNLLTVFGGIGDNVGKFDKPVSISLDSAGNVYVVDSLRQNIQKFKITNFMKKIHNASKTYFEGDYNNSFEIWKEVIDLCPDYILARRRLGKIYFKKEKYAAAKEQFLLAEDMNGYSESFYEWQKEKISDHFLLVVMVCVLIIILLTYLVSKSKKIATNIREHIYLERRSKK